jgi:hypothetical protein
VKGIKLGPNWEEPDYIRKAREAQEKLNKYNPAIEHAMKIAELGSKTGRPAIEKIDRINEIHRQAMLPLEQMKNILSVPIPKIHFEPALLGLAKISESLVNASEFHDHAKNLLDPFSKTLAIYQANYKVFAIPAINTLAQTVAASLAGSISALLEPLQNFNRYLNFDFERFEKAYLECMFECKWFPYIHDDLTMTFMREVIDIKNYTRATKSRTKKVDSYIFSIFNKTKLKAIKSEWIKLEQNKTRARIMRQCLDAHIQGHYALAISALTPLWEGIIKDKVNHQGRIRSDKVKEALMKLANDNGMPAIINDFFNDYVMYQCDDPKDIIEDVPGRHSLSHGWFNRYPSRKVSLNAILFTDFLLRLEELQDEKTSS